MRINEIQKEIHELAKQKGWYNGSQKNALEMHALISSEIGEATNEARKDKEPFYFDNDKPEGEMIELTDAVIRIMDYFEHRGWSLENAIKMKHEYNKTRSFRHGNKKY